MQNNLEAVWQYLSSWRSHSHMACSWATSWRALMGTPKAGEQSERGPLWRRDLFGLQFFTEVTLISFPFQQLEMKLHVCVIHTSWKTKWLTDVNFTTPLLILLYITSSHKQFIPVDPDLRARAASSAHHTSEGTELEFCAVLTPCAVNGEQPR